VQSVTQLCDQFCFCAQSSERGRVNRGSEWSCRGHLRGHPKLGQNVFTDEFNQIEKAVVEEGDGKARPPAPHSLIESEVEASASFRTDGCNAELGDQRGAVRKSRQQLKKRRAFIEDARFLDAFSEIEPELRITEECAGSRLPQVVAE